MRVEQPRRQPRRPARPRDSRDGRRRPRRRASYSRHHLRNRARRDPADRPTGAARRSPVALLEAGEDRRHLAEVPRERHDPDVRVASRGSPAAPPAIHRRTRRRRRRTRSRSAAGPAGRAPTDLLVGQRHRPLVAVDRNDERDASFGSAAMRCACTTTRSMSQMRVDVAQRSARRTAAGTAPACAAVARHRQARRVRRTAGRGSRRSRCRADRNTSARRRCTS